MRPEKHIAPQLAELYRDVLTTILDKPEEFVETITTMIRTIIRCNGLLIVVEPDTSENAFGQRVETIEHTRLEYEGGVPETTVVSGSIDKGEGKDLLAEIISKATENLKEALRQKYQEAVAVNAEWLSYDKHPRIAVCIFRVARPGEEPNDFNDDDRRLLAAIEPHLLACLRVYTELTRVRRASIDFFAERCHEVATAIGLTLTEFRVLRKMVEGASNKVISEELGTSLATVKTHISHILQKGGCRNRTDLIGRYFSSKSVISPQ